MWLAVVSLTGLGVVPVITSANATSAVQLEAAHRGPLENRCFGCHGNDEPSGNVRLNDLGFTIDTVAAAKR